MLGSLVSSSSSRCMPQKVTRANQVQASASVMLLARTTTNVHLCLGRGSVLMLDVF